ncbi:hypothetical protein F511_33508 [Dorcoceras hygrometricum]|uniref:Uncharacterized protein n=1 Tax=Dorcoceras hygrometricum TaxID=472368 RepID=A0A2Z7C067_9LAMI|nr:hypothetical protein F511_33508 [Dorcoceras hygrometricum]
MDNTDPNNTKAGKEIKGQASVRRAIKQLIMHMLYFNAMKCMKAIKDRIARPVCQLENQLNPVIPSQLGGRHSNPVVTTPMIALDFSGTTHQSASHNVAFNQLFRDFSGAEYPSPQNLPSQIVGLATIMSSLDCASFGCPALDFTKFIVLNFVLSSIGFLLVSVVLPSPLL